MTYFSMKDYKLKRFRKSDTKNKKYDAILEHVASGKLIKVSFGHSDYEQFKDSTGLNIFTHLNHNDPKRRQLFRQRHKKYLHDKYFSPGYFSYYYLW